MTLFSRFSSVILFFTCFLGCSIFQLAEPEKGLVTAVYDGDTIRVRNSKGRSETIRLIGIDTPELSDQRDTVKLQAFLAKRFTYFHLFQKNVRLVLEPQKRDKYGRLLAFVFIGDTLFNEKIIRDGFASVFLKYPFRNDYRRRLEQAYGEARKNQVGLWKSEPYKKINLSDLFSAQGTLVRVEFICRDIEEKRGLVLLHSQERKVAALIFRNDLAGFPDVKSFIDTKISVFGLLESYRGQPQVVLFLPRQIQDK